MFNKLTKVTGFMQISSHNQSCLNPDCLFRDLNNFYDMPNFSQGWITGKEGSHSFRAGMGNGIGFIIPNSF
jgi:hypothetical protein